MYFARLNTADYLLLPRKWLRVGAGFTGVAALGVATVQIGRAQSDGPADNGNGSLLNYGYVAIALALGLLIPWGYGRYREHRASKDRKHGDSGCGSSGCNGGSSRAGNDSTDSSSDSASGCSGCGGGD
jgi:hypothetical protein